MATDKAHAWWNLKTEQKEQLEQLRRAGRFGGTPGKFPYLWVQEGVAEANYAGAAIVPKRMLSQAADSLDALLTDILPRL